MFKFLDRCFNYKSSRQLQNYQHYVGGLYNILLVTTGIFLAKDFWSGVGVGAISFIVSRLSSEISYRTQYKIQEETNGYNTDKRNV